MEIKMRRFRQALPADISKQILSECSSGVLSLNDSDGQPYGVPLNYVYDATSEIIYFHSAKAGHKIESIGEGCICSFCVIGMDKIVPDEFTSYFRSVIVNGYIYPVTNDGERQMALRLLCDKYSPGIDSSNEINKCINHVCILRLDIKAISGKQAIELVPQR